MPLDALVLNQTALDLHTTEARATDFLHLVGVVEFLPDWQDVSFVHIARIECATADDCLHYLARLHMASAGHGVMGDTDHVEGLGLAAWTAWNPVLNALTHPLRDLVKSAKRLESASDPTETSAFDKLTDVLEDRAGRSTSQQHQRFSRIPEMAAGAARLLLESAYDRAHKPLPRPDCNEHTPSDRAVSVSAWYMCVDPTLQGTRESHIPKHKESPYDGMHSREGMHTKMVPQMSTASGNDLVECFISHLDCYEVHARNLNRPAGWSATTAEETAPMQPKISGGEAYPGFRREVRPEPRGTTCVVVWRMHAFSCHLEAHSIRVTALPLVCFGPVAPLPQDDHPECNARTFCACATK